MPVLGHRSQLVPRVGSFLFITWDRWAKKKNKKGKTQVTCLGGRGLEGQAGEGRRALSRTGGLLSLLCGPWGLPISHPRERRGLDGEAQRPPGAPSRGQY